MQVTQVATTINGPQLSAMRTWLIDQAVGALPQQIFRQVLYLRLALDGYADGVQLVPAQTHLRGRFVAYDYDAKTVANPALVAVTQTLDQAVLVTLPTPRQLTAVQLVKTLALGLSSKVTVHRVDGEQVVAEPTTAATFGAPFEILAVEGITLQGRSLGATSALTPDADRVSDNMLRSRTVFAPTVAALVDDFTDARFGLRLSNSSVTLTPAHVTGLTVRSYPSAPRLGVAASTLPLTPTFFLRLDGEIGKAGDPTAGQIDAGAALAAALQSAVDAFFAQLFANAESVSEPALPTELTTELTLALVLEADAPCQLIIDEFAVGYQLMQRNFPDRAEKRVLRFAGDTVATQAITFRLPKSAVVTQATVTVAARLQPAGLAGSTTANDLSAEQLAQATAIHLGLERWAAQPLTPPQALTASGVFLGLLPLTADTQLRLELYADWQGQPAGKQLATLTLDLGQSGERRWQPVHLAEPLLLFAQPYWLLLKAVRGAALWLAKEGTPAVQMLTSDNQRRQPLHELANTQGLVHLLSPMVAVDPAPSLALRVDGAPIMTTPVTIGDRQRHDFTAALNAALTADGGTKLNERTLTFTTGQAGLLTVYPPLILYEE